jgi:threonine/homoserine/homoserine lactone efflux protein
MVELQTELAKFNVSITYLDPDTKALNTINCIIPEANIEYYTIQDNKVSFNAFVMDFIENPQNMFWFKVIGGILLMFFGIYTYLSNPTNNLRPANPNKGSLWHNGITGFLVTFSNPLIILLFIALMARFEFVVPEHYWEQGLGYVAIFAGALLWWFGLTYIIDKVRTKFQVSTICLINRIIGSIVIVAGFIGFLWALLPHFGINI